MKIFFRKYLNKEILCQFGNLLLSYYMKFLKKYRLHSGKVDSVYQWIQLYLSMRQIKKENNKQYPQYKNGY